MMSSVLGVEPDQVKIGTKVNARIDNTGEKPELFLILQRIKS